MKRILIIFICIFIAFTLYTCKHGTDPDELGDPGITETGPTGPDDFIGFIDLNDWDRASYEYLLKTDTYWINGISDSIYPSPERRITIHNSSQNTMTVGIATPQPFLCMNNSISISPGQSAFTYFALDTNAVGNNTMAIGKVTLTISLGSSTEQRDYILRWTKPTQGGGVVVSLPTADCLMPAYPNPADGFITISFSIHTQQQVLLTVLNNKKQPVDTIIDSRQAAGTYKCIWNTTPVERATFPPGYYRIILKTESYSCSGDILLQ